MDEYGEAKFRIFANQGPGDTFVGNLDDPIVGELAEGESAKRVPARWWFALAPHRMTTLYVRHERITFAPPMGDPRPVEIMPVSEIPLQGRTTSRTSWPRSRSAWPQASIPKRCAPRSASSAAAAPPAARRAAERRHVRRRFQIDQSRLRDRGARIVLAADRADRRRQVEAHRFSRDGRRDRQSAPRPWS
jgi:hypothetical protein